LAANSASAACKSPGGGGAENQGPIIEKPNRAQGSCGRLSLFRGDRLLSAKL
jgi:hypothetical protein